MNYWDNRYTYHSDHHSDQNSTISIDFLKQADNAILERLQDSKSILEIGCGTGEFCELIKKKFNTISVTGIDVSDPAIEICKKKYPDINFYVADASVYNFESKYDIIISSNTLEHFKDPYVVIDRAIKFSNYFLAIVPFKQPCTDGYDGEGGAGHVFTFDVDSFNKYNIISYMTFKTNGWVYSSRGEEPRQLVVLFCTKQ
jgi:ubiquinone/menaquinone biosynthesis C-methylase UbiE